MWLDDKSKNLIKWVPLHFVVEYFYTYVHACGPTLLANETDPPNHLFYAHMIGFDDKKRKKRRRRKKEMCMGVGPCEKCVHGRD